MMWAQQSGIEFVGPNNSFRTHYTPLRPSRDASDVSSMGALDVIITGIVCGLAFDLVYLVTVSVRRRRRTPQRGMDTNI